MKKACIIFVLSLVSTYVFAQDVEIGIQLMPNISYSRIAEELKDGVYSPDGAKLKFAIGPVVDIHLTPNICVSTGAFFSTRAVKYTSAVTNTAGAVSASDVEVNLQYIQIPLGLKFFTGEIASNTKLFFQLGGLLDTKIAEKYAKESSLANGTLTGEDIDQKFAKLVSAGVNLTIGAEYELGSNKAYAGIAYNRGLSNMLHKDFAAYANKKDVKINADMIGLVLGFKF